MTYVGISFFFLFVFCLFPISFDNCRSKICIVTEKWTLPYNPKKMLFTVWIYRSLFDWLSLLLSQTYILTRSILQISCFYKTKIPDKATAVEPFLINLKAVKAFSTNIYQFSSPPKDCNFRRGIQNPAKHLRWSIL